jgi:hypothetical protein
VFAGVIAGGVAGAALVFRRQSSGSKTFTKDIND